MNNTTIKSLLVGLVFSFAMVQAIAQTTTTSPKGSGDTSKISKMKFAPYTKSVGALYLKYGIGIGGFSTYVLPNSDPDLIINTQDVKQKDTRSIVFGYRDYGSKYFSLAIEFNYFSTTFDGTIKVTNRQSGSSVTSTNSVNTVFSGLLTSVPFDFEYPIDQLSLFAQVKPVIGYLNIKTNNNSESALSYGFGTEIGARYLLTNNIGIEGSLGLVNTSQVGVDESSNTPALKNNSVLLSLGGFVRFNAGGLVDPSKPKGNYNTVYYSYQAPSTPKASKQDTILTNSDKVSADTLRLAKASPNGAKLKREAIIKRCIDGSVSVINDDSHGSGFFISNAGYIVTNEHVVGDAKTVDIRLSGGIKIKGTVLRSNPKYDLALIKVDGDGFNALPIGNADSTSIGADVFAIGTPFSTELSATVTRGIISGKREANGVRLLQSDVAVNSGNSGGPIINEKGEVIGVTASKLSRIGIEGIGFSISIDELQDALKVIVW